MEKIMTTSMINVKTTEKEFKEWKEAILAKVKSNFPSILAKHEQVQNSLKKSNEYTLKLMNEMNELENDEFDEVMSNLLSTISRYDYQEHNFSLVSKKDFDLKFKRQEENNIKGFINNNSVAWLKVMDVETTLLKIADKAYEMRKTNIFIPEENYFRLDYRYNKFHFFAEMYNFSDSPLGSKEEYDEKQLPILLKASEFSEEKVLAFLEEILKYEVYEALQLEVEKEIKKIVEDTQDGVANFDVNALNQTKLELVLDFDKNKRLLKNIALAINLTVKDEVILDEKTFNLLKDNPSKMIKVGCLKVSLSKNKSYYSDQKIKIKYDN